MLHYIDGLHLGNPGIIGISVIEAEDGSLALIDSGPATVFESTCRGLTAKGLDPARVRSVLITHVHLDHSGGAWRWNREFGTTVYAHPKGVPHLLSPEKLVASATRIYADQMQTLWGEVQPIPAKDLKPVTSGAIIAIGPIRLEAIDTPGHAQHHNVYWWADTSTVFGGDVTGVRIGSGPVIPPLPPPDIHLESWRESLQKIRILAPRRLFATHFGELGSPPDALAELEKRLGAWANWMRERMAQGLTEAQILPAFLAFVDFELRQAGVSVADRKAYEQADPAAMTVTGLTRYWRKYHPDLISRKPTETR